MQLLQALPHTQASFDFCNTVSLARRYHYSHFTGEEIEAPQERDTGWATDILNLDPKPQPFRPLAWVSLCVCGLLRASRCGGQAWGLPKFCHHFWTGHTGSWERAPWSPSLSGSLEDSEVQSEQGCKWVAQRWVPEGWRAGWGVSRCTPGRQAGELLPLPRIPSPTPPPRPSQHSPQRRFIRGGRARHGCASRGCFLAQWTKHFWRVQEGTEHSVHFGGLRDSWTDTSVLSHATRLIAQPPSLPPSLPPPPIPTSHPLPCPWSPALLRSRLWRNHSKWPQEVNTWIT